VTKTELSLRALDQRHSRRIARHEEVYHNADERRAADLYGLLTAGKAAARKLTRARILLKADSGSEGPAWTDAAISEALE